MNHFDKMRNGPDRHGSWLILDFRFLMYPTEGFSADDLKWAEAIVLGVMVDRSFGLSRQLVETPRWAAAKRSGRHLFGVVVLHSQISPHDSTFDCDREGRALCCFLGYVSRDRACSHLPPTDIEVCRPPFQIVRDQWADEIAKRPFASSYNVSLPVGPPVPGGSAPFRKGDEHRYVSCVGRTGAVVTIWHDRSYDFVVYRNQPLTGRSLRSIRSRCGRRIPNERPANGTEGHSGFIPPSQGASTSREAMNLVRPKASIPAKNRKSPVIPACR